MKKRTSEEFVKSLPNLTGKEKASPLLRKTIKVANGEAGGETALIEPTKKDDIRFVGHVKTMNEKFFDIIESSDTWGTMALIVTGVFIVAIIYWGFNQ